MQILHKTRGPGILLAYASCAWYAISARAVGPETSKPGPCPERNGIMADLAALPKKTLVNKVRRMTSAAAKVAEASARGTEVVASSGGAVIVGIMHQKWPHLGDGTGAKKYITPGVAVGAALTALGLAGVGGQKAADMAMAVGQGMVNGHLAITALTLAAQAK